jgi:hypothetical protein
MSRMEFDRNHKFFSKTGPCCAWKKEINSHTNNIYKLDGHVLHSKIQLKGNEVCSFTLNAMSVKPCLTDLLSLLYILYNSIIHHGYNLLVFPRTILYAVHSPYYSFIAVTV